MTEREYDVTVTTDFSKIFRVRAANATEAKKIIARELSNEEDIEGRILEIFEGNVGSETIQLVEPVVYGPGEGWDLRQCVGVTQRGSRCVRRAWAAAEGYLCMQHLWQDGVEEGSQG